MPDRSRLVLRFPHAADDEPQDFLPFLEKVVIAEVELAIAVVRKVGSGSLALPPVLAAACPIIGGYDIDVVRPAGGPVVTGAFAIVVLPGRAQALAELSRL